MGIRSLLGLHPTLFWCLFSWRGLSEFFLIEFLKDDEVEDQGKYHLFLCDRCGGRLKVVTTLSTLSPPGLILAEFAMLHLDWLEPQEIA